MTVLPPDIANWIARNSTGVGGFTKGGLAGLVLVLLYPQRIHEMVDTCVKHFVDAEGISDLVVGGLCLYLFARTAMVILACAVNPYCLAAATLIVFVTQALAGDSLTSATAGGPAESELRLSDKAWPRLPGPLRPSVPIAGAP